MANRYFIQGLTGNNNWNDAANWASVSGGTHTTETIPNANDDVFLDSNSPVCIVDSAATCKSLTLRDYYYSSLINNDDYNAELVDFPKYLQLNADINVLYNLFAETVVWGNLPDTPLTYIRGDGYVKMIGYDDGVIFGSNMSASYRLDIDNLHIEPTNSTNSLLTSGPIFVRTNFYAPELQLFTSVNIVFFKNCEAYIQTINVGSFATFYCYQHSWSDPNNLEGNQCKLTIESIVGDSADIYVGLDAQHRGNVLLQNLIDFGSAGGSLTFQMAAYNGESGAKFETLKDCGVSIGSNATMTFYNAYYMRMHKLNLLTGTVRVNPINVGDVSLVVDDLTVAGSGSVTITTLSSSVFPRINVESTFTINNNNVSSISAAGRVMIHLTGPNVIVTSNQTSSTFRCELLFNTDGYVRFRGNPFRYQTTSGTSITHLKGTVYLDDAVLSASNIIGGHKIFWKNITVTGGGTITMDRFFNGTASRPITINSSSTSNYTIALNAAGLAIYKQYVQYVKLQRCTIAATARGRIVVTTIEGNHGPGNIGLVFAQDAREDFYNHEWLERNYDVLGFVYNFDTLPQSYVNSLDIP